MREIFKRCYDIRVLIHFTTIRTHTESTTWGYWCYLPARPRSSSVPWRHTLTRRRDRRKEDITFHDIPIESIHFYRFFAPSHTRHLFSVYGFIHLFRKDQDLVTELGSHIQMVPEVSFVWLFFFFFFFFFLYFHFVEHAYTHTQKGFGCKLGTQVFWATFFHFFFLSRLHFFL